MTAVSVTAADGVTASESGRDDATRWLPWTFRRILALPGHPLALGAGATLLFLAIATVWLNTAGVWDGFDYQGRPFWAQANSWNNPKGTHLSACSQADLNRTALRLNQRPRKTLAFRSPAELINESVALTGRAQDPYRSFQERS